MVLSAHLSGNADVFPQVLALHVPKGSTVADVTWGKGVFWQNVPPSAYKLLATDMKTGTDCRNLPYEAGSIDAVFLLNHPKLGVSDQVQVDLISIVTAAKRPLVRRERIW